MKTVTVTVQIQMDVDANKDVLSQVQNTLELMNNEVSSIDSSPQIFMSDISNSDIIEDNVMCVEYSDFIALPNEEGKCNACGGDCLEQ